MMQRARSVCVWWVEGLCGSGNREVGTVRMKAKSFTGSWRLSANTHKGLFVALITGIGGARA